MAFAKVDAPPSGDDFPAVDLSTVTASSSPFKSMGCNPHILPCFNLRGKTPEDRARRH